MSFRTKIFDFLNIGTVNLPDHTENEDSADRASGEIRWEVREVFNRFTHAIRDKNRPLLSELMTDDIVLLAASGDPIVGRDAVEAFCTGTFSKFLIRQHTDFSVEASDKRTTASVYAGAFIALTPIEGGDVVEMRHSFTGVLRHENGGWKVARVLSLTWIWGILGNTVPRLPPA